MSLICNFIYGDLELFAGTVAIFIFSLSYVGKLLYEQMKLLIWEHLNVWSQWVLLNSMLLDMQYYQLYCHHIYQLRYLNFEGNVRYAAILGYVGAGGIGMILNEKLGWREYSKVGTIVFLLLLTVFVIEIISEHFRERLE